MDFDTPGNRLDAEVFTGSMQQLLILHKGEPILAEFLIGTNSMVTKSGILYEVGEKYLILYASTSNTFTVCDVFNLKFVTFPRNGTLR